MKYLLLLIIFITIFYLGVTAVLRGFFRFMTGTDPRRPQQDTRRVQYKKPEKEKWYAPKKKKSKVIDDDEGEYVEYEEIEIKED